MTDDNNTHSLDADETESGTLRTTRSSEGTYHVYVRSNDSQDSTTVDVVDDDPGPPEVEGEVIGYIEARDGNENVSIPVYDPNSIPYPCWRVQVDDNLTGAFHIEDRQEADFRSFSVETIGGPKGITETEIDLTTDVNLTVDAPSEIQQGEDFNAYPTVINTGETEVSGEVILYYDNSQQDSTTFDLDVDESANFMLSGTSEREGEIPWEVEVPEYDSVSGTVQSIGTRHLIDDFSHNSLTDYYEGNTDHYYLDTTWSYQGDYCLRRDENYVGAMINSYSGLDTYPEQGDRINFIFRTNVDETATDSIVPSIRFGHEDDSRFYEARFRIDRSRMLIYERHPDYDATAWNLLRIEDINLNFPSHTNVMFSVFWGSDNIGMRLYNDESNSPITPYIAASPEYHHATEGGVGLSLESVSSDHQLLADYLHVDDL